MEELGGSESRREGTRSSTPTRSSDSLLHDRLAPEKSVKSTHSKRSYRTVSVSRFFFARFSEPKTSLTHFSLGRLSPQRSCHQPRLHLSLLLPLNKLELQPSSLPSLPSFPLRGYPSSLSTSSRSRRQPTKEPCTHRFLLNRPIQLIRTR